MGHIAIVGCGAIGGLAGFYMARAGESVLFIDSNVDHVNAIRTRGLSVQGVYGPMAVGAQRACTPEELAEPLTGLVFLACKSQATESAVRPLVPYLAPDSCVVSLQNGMNEGKIADLVGRERTMGALPDYGGAYLDPGVLETVHEGPVYVGELNGGLTGRAKEAARLLGIGPNECELLTDIVGRVWTKLVYFSQVVVTALVDASMIEVFREETAQRLAGLVVREAMQVSDAAGVRLHADRWFDPSLYRASTPDDTQRLFAANARLVAHLGAHHVATAAGEYVYIKKASGVHWDIVYRKRKSEAQYLTVVCVADQYRVSVPLNTRLIEMIAEIEDGKRHLGWHNIDELAAYADEMGVRLP